MKHLAIAGILVPLALATASVAEARTLYVRSGADAGGSGTRAAPLNSLRRVEARSRAGDRIVVLAAPASAGALDGGIQLKRGQQLVGSGPPVARAKPPKRAARVTNSGDSHIEGDAVRLASRTTVRNLEITGPTRGGIYGNNTGGVSISGNSVSAHNASCTRGFHIPPFAVPTTLPGIGVPIPDGLHNGWAGIMVDADRRRSRPGQITITGNRVHDAECGDGIDIRASGSARVRAEISHNKATELGEGEGLSSILAFGLQAREDARLEATLDANRQSALGNDEDLGIGPTGADSEGIFVNPVGPARMRVEVTRNRYTHTPGRGGFSANGLEFVSMDNGSRARLDVRDSTFSGTSGDVLEQLALGTNGQLKLSLDNVVARDSTGFGGSGFGDTVVIPGNNADCLIAASGGAGNAVDLRIRDTKLTGCANNGLTFGSSVANGSGPTASLKLDISDSEITGNGGGNLRLGNVGSLDTLEAKVQRTDLSHSHGRSSTPANLTVEDLGRTRHATIDLGGGRLGSRGDVCLEGGSLGAALIGYDVTARGAWWGTPGGPGPGRVLAVGGKLDSARALEAQPRSCRN